MGQDGFGTLERPLRGAAHAFDIAQGGVSAHQHGSGIDVRLHQVRGLFVVADRILVPLQLIVQAAGRAIDLVGLGIQLERGGDFRRRGIRRRRPAAGSGP